MHASNIPPTTVCMQPVTLHLLLGYAPAETTMPVTLDTWPIPAASADEDFAVQAAYL